MSGARILLNEKESAKAIKSGKSLLVVLEGKTQKKLTKDEEEKIKAVWKKMTADEGIVEMAKPPYRKENRGEKITVSTALTTLINKGIMPRLSKKRIQNLKTLKRKE